MYDFSFCKKPNYLKSKTNVDSILDISIRNVCDFGKINDVLSIRFFNYKMAIAFLVIVNIKYDTLDYE